MTVIPPNDISIQKETLRSREQGMVELAQWWGKRLVSGGREVSEQSFFEKIELPRKLRERYVALVTHHTHNEQSKAEILELGGLIGVPDTEQLLFYGQDAASQVLASLGLGRGHYANNPRDGLTFVYLHPVPPEIYKDCEVVVEGYSPLAKAFGENLKPEHLCRADVERVLMYPWDTLYVEQTSQPGKLRQILEPKRGVFEFVDFNDPKFVYRLRMLDNKFLLGVI